MKTYQFGVALAALTATSAFAQLNTSTWDGGGNPDPNWSNGLNWVGDVPPTETGGTVNAANPDRSIIFSGTTNLTSNQDIPNVGGGGFNIGNITFNNTAGAFTLNNSTGTGLDMLGVRNTAVASSITNNSTSLQTLNIGLISRPDFTSTLIFDTAPGDITVNGGISTGGAGTGSGGITKNGTGTLTLTGAKTYTGATVINGGVLSANVLSNGGTASSIGQSSSASSNLVFNGGTLRWTGTGGGTAIDRGFTLGAGGGTFESVGSPFRFTGIVTGAGDFTKTGANTLAFSGANNYTGQTFVNASTLFLRTAASLGAGGTTASGTTVASGATLTIDTGSTSGGSGVNATFNEFLTLNGGTLVNNNLANTWTAPITVNNASTISVLAGSLTVSGPTTLNATLTAAPVAGTTLSMTGPIDGAGGIAKTSNGTLILSGNNSYLGATTVAANGALRVASNNALGATSAGTTVTDLGALQVEGGITLAAEPITIGGLGIGGTGALRNISGNNTLTGPISTTAGIQTRIQSDAGLLAINGGITSLGGNTLFLSGAGNGEANSNITGVFQLNKEGAGTWTLNGASTTVLTGNPTGLDLNVNGGTLAGITSVVSRNSTINPTATLSPGINGGTAAGTFAVSGNLLFGAGSTANIQVATPDATFTDFAALAALTDPVVLAGTDDFISVGGALSTNAASTIALDFTGYTPRIGDAFDLFDFATGPAILPIFTLSGANFSGFALDTSRFRSLGVVAIVPEPSRALLLILGVAMLGRRRRRR